MVDDLVGAVKHLAGVTKDLGLRLQGKKCAIVARDSRLAERLVSRLKGIGIGRRLAVRIRGSDFAGGSRRSTVVRTKRINRAKAMGPRLRALRRAGVNATGLFNTGAASGAPWGVAVDGISDAKLAGLRHTAGLAARAAAGGRSLTLELALAPGRRSDPFVGACALPVVAWATAVWDSRMPSWVLNLTFCEAVGKFADGTKACGGCARSCGRFRHDPAQAWLEGRLRLHCSQR